jgi:hypothetical protein
MSRNSNFEFVGGTIGSPDYIYYNCDIINNQTDSVGGSGLVEPDPAIRFNETRDTALVKDASLYYFSIVRFTMNGANRDLPLFIPVIQTGQTNQNLTTYQVALTLQQTWNTSTGPIAFNITPTPTTLIYQPETQNPILAPLPRPPTEQQDLSSRYYWVYTYQHWIDIVNNHLLIAHQALFTAFQAAWALATADPFPYANFDAFASTCQTPCMKYDKESGQLFSIYADSDGFGQRLENFTPIPFNPGPPPVAGPATKPTMRLFFNTNMYGMFANFNNVYWNTPNIGVYNVNPNYILPAFPAPVPIGYTNEILFVNKCFQNVSDWRLPPYSGTPPLGYVPTTPSNFQKVYWVCTQDYRSVDTLWSPVSSIVFTSTLLPIKSEATGQPNILGTGNLGDSQPTSQSAFQPIITDIALDLIQGGADDYRQFIFYAPSAEYRLADLSPSKQEIRNIDIQVFWKNRLNNQLYPVQMFNLSSVGIKVMFAKKSAKGKTDI